jgi:hypothetical protein
LTRRRGGAEEDAEKTVESVKSAESAEILGLRGGIWRIGRKKSELRSD